MRVVFTKEIKSRLDSLPLTSQLKASRLIKVMQNDFENLSDMFVKISHLKKMNRNVYSLRIDEHYSFIVGFKNEVNGDFGANTSDNFIAIVNLVKRK